jgi:hypothetical protein
MDENDSSNDLATLAEFRSPLEAALAQARLAAEGIETTLDGAATANWLNHVGPDLIGASLSVRQGDLDHAREVLSNIRAEASTADDEEEEPIEDEFVPTPPMARAFRAAVIGAFLFPPLLSIYSLAIIVKHRLWEPQPGETSVNWRLPAALVFQVLGLLLFWWLVTELRSYAS